jgi:hypothetical protein
MTTEQKIIRAKVGLLELAKQLGNVSQACKNFVLCGCGWRPDLGKHYRVWVLEAADERPGGK